MILRFHSIEAAALFVASRRNDGYFAKLCDESMGTFWGPGPPGGVRVVTSEEALEETDDFEPVQPSDGWFIRLLKRCARMVFWSAVLVILLTSLVVFLSDPLAMAWRVIVLAFMGGCCLVAATLVSLISFKLATWQREAKFLPLRVFWFLLAAALCLCLSIVKLDL